MEFKIKIEDEELGPYSLKELKDRLAAGSLTFETPVRPVKGGGDFVPISDWVSPDEIKEEKSPAPPGSGSGKTNSLKAPGVKLPAKKVARKAVPHKAPARKVTKKKQSLKSQVIAAAGSVTFAVVLILLFLFFWERTGVELSLPGEEVTLLKNGEEVSFENQTYRQGRMAPGEYEFTVRHSDPLVEEWHTTVTVSFGRLHEESVTLEPMTAVLHLQTEDDGASFVLSDPDGQEHESGPLPASLRSLPMGHYTISFTSETGETEEKPIYLHPEAPEGVEVSAESEFVLTWAPPVVVEEDFDDLFAEDEEVEEVEEVQIDPGRAGLVVETKPEGVRVGVFGPNEFSWRGTTPVTLNDLEPGEYEIEFRPENREIVSKDVQLEKDKLHRLEEDFTGGTVRVVTEPPGAFVNRGNRFLGRTPITLENLPVGEVAFEVGFPGQETTTLEGRITDTPLVLGARFSDGSWVEEEAYYQN
ncbi:MAG: hypothetical protein LAT55_08130 [Opitutales bacterium]|nr:hypothetical protein [Opitutales bacterium]